MLSVVKGGLTSPNEPETKEVKNKGDQDSASGLNMEKMLFFASQVCEIEEKKNSSLFDDKKGDHGVEGTDLAAKPEVASKNELEIERNENKNQKLKKDFTETPHPHHEIEATSATQSSCPAVQLEESRRIELETGVDSENVKNINRNRNSTRKSQLTIASLVSLKQR